MLDISLLGAFCIRQDDEVITSVDTPRLQSLLTYLLLHKDTPQSRAQLSYLFWPDTSDAQARTNLRNLLHHLRHVLPEAETYLEISTQSLQWRSDGPITLDVTEFRKAVSQASEEIDSRMIRAALERAIGLYQGDLLPCCYDDWIIPQREELQQAYLHALERLIDLLEELGEFQAAIHQAQRLLHHDPLQESVYRRLMRLHALNGDRASALRVYHTCTTTLQRELDIEPSLATREAYEELLGRQPPPSITSLVTSAFCPLVGRESEWSQVTSDWHMVIKGLGPHVTILRGEAGIGKTRLVEEFLQWAARQGITAVSTRCYSAEGALAYAPVISWLRTQSLASVDDLSLIEISRLLPEIITRRPNLPEPSPLSEPWQRQRLFGSLSKAVLSLPSPLLLVIEDMQWCDRDTLEWLHFLFRVDLTAKMLLIGTFRSEEITDNHPVTPLLLALRKETILTEIDLQPLPEDETRCLASFIAGEEVDDEYAHFLYHETEGNPLFVVEMVRAGTQLPAQISSGEHPAEYKTTSTRLPPKVQSVLEARLAQVSLPARNLVGLAAVIGREFNFKLLSKAGPCDEDTLVRLLDELWQRRIIREHGMDAYDFSHDKLREVAYHGLSHARRQLLHRQVAEALVTLNQMDLTPVSGQLASHYEQAGLIEKAIPFYFRAAEKARQVYSNDEAVSLLKHAISIFMDIQTTKTLNQGDKSIGPQLFETLGDILEHTARHNEAIQTYQNARILISKENNIWQARLSRKIATAQKELRQYHEALESCRTAENLLGAAPDTALSDWWDEWLDVQVELAWAYYWLARWAEMDLVMKRLQPVVKVYGSNANRVRLEWVTCLMRLRRYRYVVSDEMLSDAQEGLRASLEWGDPKFIILCQFELGFLHLWRRELSEAEQNLLIALELVEKSGALPVQTLCLTYLTVLNRFKGDLKMVEEYACRALQSAEAAKMPDYIAAAKGNQAWLAVRDGDLRNAEQLGRESLEIWHRSPLVYPFQWQAIWPLIGSLLANNRLDEALPFTAELLEEKQQLLPGRMVCKLHEIQNAQIVNQTEDAVLHLVCASKLAATMGYL